MKSNQDQFIVITGLSGAGKTLALRLFEDMGFFCVDNLPAVLLPKFSELCAHSELRKAAVVVDVRGREFLEEFFSSMKAVRQSGFATQILFLEASDEVLLRRFSETKRKHPLASSGRVNDGIRLERRQLREIRGGADKILDTSAFTPKELKEELVQAFRKPGTKPLDLYLLSFGYKYGLPLDADLVVDVRFIPNPFYRKDLQNLNGNDEQVRKYVLKWPQSKEFLRRLVAFLESMLPYYMKEVKSHVTIAIGCTGGRHRSIAFANEIARLLRKLNYKVRVHHRDLRR